MSALLKIVQGPNAGAEIALPDGVEITVGKADTCDIVLADPTLPDEPLKLSADASGGVTLDGEPLEPYYVRLFGSTALAVGPADAAWPPLIFPSPEPAADSGTAPSDSGSAGTPPAEPPPSQPNPPANSKNPKPPKKRSRLPRFLLALLALLLLLVLLLVLLATCSRTRAAHDPSEGQTAADDHSLSAIASRYNLDLDDSTSRPALSGNFATRAERLAATADLYSSFPGVALDLTDDESLRSAVADSLFTLGQANLTVASVSNRVATLAGSANSPAALSAAVDALRADIPRLNEIDISAVTIREPVVLASSSSTLLDGDDEIWPTSLRRRRSRSASANASTNAPATPSLPVCGILTTPYPCLVLQNGSRVFPGATLGGSVVVSIAPDSVVLTNANGSFTWKP